ncbi:hypothetical protein EDC94DRAFT_284103 [Helicostylum pulchrum]|nr:hypothetical protein EDC94DRAFT_284103 [Helicostylum pulchrum]
MSFSLKKSFRIIYSARDTNLRFTVTYFALFTLSIYTFDCSDPRKGIEKVAFHLLTLFIIIKLHQPVIKFYF